MWAEPSFASQRVAPSTPLVERGTGLMQGGIPEMRILCMAAELGPSILLFMSNRIRHILFISAVGVLGPHFRWLCQPGEFEFCMHD
jgi:hypothetical protein